MSNFAGSLRGTDGGHARREYDALLASYQAGETTRFDDGEVYARVRNRVSGYISSRKLPYRLRTQGAPFLALWLEHKTVTQTVGSTMIAAPSGPGM